MRSLFSFDIFILTVVMLLGCSPVKKEEAVTQADPAIVRSAKGAGKWFPASKSELESSINEFLDKATPEEINGRIVGAIAPHAGYIYSGPVAGYTFRAIRDNIKNGKVPDVVVIVGFSHSLSFSGVALMDGDAIRTPLGEVEIDTEAGDFLVLQSDRIFFDYSPHDGEHSAENEIPFVQAVLPEVKIVTAIIGDHDLETITAFEKALAKLADQKRVLLVASTDMLHDASYDQVSKTDKATLKLVDDMDYDGLLKDWSPSRQVFCGITAVQLVMRFAEKQGCKAGNTLYYRNSGDDHPESRGSWVVGYGSVVFAVKE